MPDSLGLVILGEAEVLARFDHYRDLASGHNLAVAGQAAGLLIANAWKELAPVLTGTYRASIHIEVEEVDEEGCRIWIGTSITNPPYPLFLEYGTSRMIARPSATPAFDHNVERAQREVVAVLRHIFGVAA